MTNAAITVHGLRKMYRLGSARKVNQTFQEMLKELVAAPVRRLGPSGPPVAAPEEFWALDDVSFEIDKGDVVGIIGRNGAGKSTLLKVLSRIVEPTSGEAILRGRVASLLEVGTGFHPELSGRENIYLNGSILGMKRREIDARFDEIVAFAEVEKFLDTPVKRYSSGMYVRLAFAVAAHLEPEILIVDEVLAVGDVHFQQKCLGKMQDVVKQGRTILFVSHQMAAVSQLCRRIIWLDRGRIVENGPTAVVLPKYLERGVSHAPRVSFERPADGTGFFFSELTLVGHQGDPSTELDARFPFRVQVTYEVERPLAGVEMAIRIRNSDAVPVFTSVYSHHSDVSKMDKAPGRRRASLEVPGHFLMPGSYTLSVHAFRDRGDFEALRILDNVLQFNVCETGTKMGKYTDQKAIGMVLVDFPWADGPSDATPRN